jgi:transcriptional regulator with XRE-family HTH domain
MPIKKPVAGSINDFIVKEVRAEMARQGVTQGLLAETLGITQNSISRRLTGKVDLTFGEVEKIATALSVSIDQFIPPIARARRAS